jgi:hypothetical protein
MILVVGMTFSLVGCPLVAFFPDKGLENAIRAQLGKPLGLITGLDLWSIRELDARNRSIRDLSGIEDCLNLAWLDLDTNKISNLGPLEQLGRPSDPSKSPLVYLNLDANEVTDITPLAGLLNLKQLSLFNNQVADITPLVTLVQAGGALESVVLDAKTLNDRAINVDIPLLESYGVQVTAAIPQSSGTGSGSQ